MPACVRSVGRDRPPACVDRRCFGGGPRLRASQGDAVSANKDMSGENRNNMSFFVDNIVLFSVIRQNMMKWLYGHMKVKDI